MGRSSPIRSKTGIGLLAVAASPLHEFALDNVSVSEVISAADSDSGFYQHLKSEDRPFEEVFSLTLRASSLLAPSFRTTSTTIQSSICSIVDYLS